MTISVPLDSDSDDEYGDIEAPPMPILPAASGVTPGFKTLRSPVKPALYSLVSDHILRKNVDFPYDSLGKDQIRILELQDGKENEKISCALITKRLYRTRPAGFNYHALSYVWGDDSLDIEIDVFNRVSEKKPQLRTNGSSPSLGSRSQTAPVPESKRDARALWMKAINQGPRTKFFIGKNLYAALKQLRSLYGKSWIWVDAVCINQESKDEKNEQLARMHDIYNKAANVFIWLGEADEKGRTDKAMAFINKAIDLRNLDNLLYNDKHIDDWHSLAELMSFSWFSRRWVVQEVALARHATLLCGNKSVNWLDFADAVAIFVTKLDEVKALYRSSKISDYLPEDLSFVESSGATIMISTINNLFGKSDDGTVMERHVSLETLVSTLLTFDVKNPKDIVYALLSIAKDSPLANRSLRPSGEARRSILQPDYNKDALEVYKDFFDHCIKSGSLDIICRHWALPIKREMGKVSIFAQQQEKITLKLPSWIGIIHDSAFGAPNRLEGRVNADSLVGNPNESRYNACDNEPPQTWFEDCRVPLRDPLESSQQTLFDQTCFGSSDSENLTMVYDVTLYCKGMVLGKITKMSDRMINATLPRNALELGGWPSPDHPLPKKVPEKLWRTLVADRGPDGRNPPGWYHKACLTCLAQINGRGDLDLSKMITEERTPELAVRFLKRVQSIVWSRKLLSAESTGGGGRESLFGLGPEKMEEGDLICILFGCSVPVVLRRHYVEATASSCFEFIGESYIHGKMNGEALFNLDHEQLCQRTEVFKLR